MTMRNITAVNNTKTCGCARCGLTSDYKFADFNMNRECKFCNSFEARSFAGKEKLIRDIDLKDGEKLGITVSGGKDSIFMWGYLTEILGRDKIAAFTYYRPGVSSPVAMENVNKTQMILGTEIHVYNDDSAYERFRTNLGILLENPDPAAVRVLLCAGCRYGITGQLYEEGKTYGVKKFISGASYLELAPFKEELLMARANDGRDIDDGFMNVIGKYPKLDYGNNLEIIKRDQHYKYKNNCTMHNQIKTAPDIRLFDFDDYFENDPETIEKTVREKYGWNKTDRSWHFDCIVEDIKDVFYYGLLGYTEMNFKLAAMVRYGLLTKEEADERLKEEEYKLKHSYKRMRDILHEHGLDKYEPQLKKLYSESRYLIYDEERREAC